MHNKKNNRKKIKDIRSELKRSLRLLYKDRLVSVILYGSYARNQADEDSDIDVAVILKGRVSPGKEIDSMLDVITELSLKYNTLISVYPVSENAFHTRQSPVIMNLRTEGVSL